MAGARAHHYVPQFWLAGFTDTGEKDGRLYVTDLRRTKQWNCKPSEAGHRRDYNRVEDPSISDPLAIEKLFAEIEGKVAPIFKQLFDDKRGPNTDYELGNFIEYIALQWIRVPAFRALVNRTVRAKMTKEIMSTRERWEAVLTKVGVPLDDPNAEYPRIVEMMNHPETLLSAMPGFYLQLGSRVLQDVASALRMLRWQWLVSPTGQFIGSDDPVLLDGESGQPIGFQNAEIVSFPVNRFVYLFGTREAVEVPYMTTKIAARHNTFTMLRSDEQVYSHRPDFHWLSSADKCKNDWTLFSKSDFEK